MLFVIAWLLSPTEGLLTRRNQGAKPGAGLRVVEEG